MGKNDSEVINTRDRTRILELVFDDGDDILKGLKETMSENGIKKMEIIEFVGKIKNFTVNYFLQNNLRTLEVQDEKEVVRAKGELLFEPTHNALFGRIRFVYRDKDKTFEGIMIKAEACQDLKLSFKYTI